MTAFSMKSGKIAVHVAIALVVAVQASCALDQEGATSSLAVANARQQTIDDVKATVDANNRVHTYGDKQKSRDGVYDCEDHARDVVAGLRTRGYDVREAGFIKGTGGMANTALDWGTGHYRQNPGGTPQGHSQISVRIPYESNADMKRVMIFEPQSGEVVTEWIADPDAGFTPPTFAQRNWERKVAETWPEYADWTGDTFMYSETNSKGKTTSRTYESQFEQGYKRPIDSHGVSRDVVEGYLPGDVYYDEPN